MSAQATGTPPQDDDPDTDGKTREARYFRPIPIESRRMDVASLALELQQLLDLGPGENSEALHRVGQLVASLRKVLPRSHFRDERLRDIVTDFTLWFSKGPRLQFDYNDEALRSMLLVDIHRLNSSG